MVPVAGLGTRLLPATKSQPKEMLPVARKPIVQYVAEELVANGIEQILFVTGRNKSSIENHFDYDPELFQALSRTNKHSLLEEVDFQDLRAKFFYTRQAMQRGLGDAILCAENFAGEEPFVAALGDSIIGLNAQSKAVTRMVELFESRHASCVLAVEEVPREQTIHYGVVQPAGGEDEGGAFRVANLGHRRPLCVLASDLRDAAPPGAGHARRGAAYRRHPTAVRRGPARIRHQASGRGKTVRHRQFSQLFYDLC